MILYKCICTFEGKCCTFYLDFEPVFDPPCKCPNCETDENVEYIGPVKVEEII